MSRHFILDGYNVLHTSDRWSDASAHERRIKFLNYLDEQPPTRSQRNSMTVVLDGYAASLNHIKFKYVRLVFSGDDDADSHIQRLVADMAHPAEATVVTNDKALRAAVRSLGAGIMSCEEFFQRRKKKAALRHIEKMDPPLAEDINRELKRLWKLD